MLDATHFRQRAARAREMAQSGDDLRLSRMLLDVAVDLDAEAEAMEAEMVMQARVIALPETLMAVVGTERKAGWADPPCTPASASPTAPPPLGRPRTTPAGTPPHR
jgi:hypothetical protein